MTLSAVKSVCRVRAHSPGVGRGAGYWEASAGEAGLLVTSVGTLGVCPLALGASPSREPATCDKTARVQQPLLHEFKWFYRWVWLPRLFLSRTLEPARTLGAPTVTSLQLSPSINFPQRRLSDPFICALLWQYSSRALCSESGWLCSRPFLSPPSWPPEKKGSSPKTWTGIGEAQGVLPAEEAASATSLGERGQSLHFKERPEQMPEGRGGCGVTVGATGRAAWPLPPDGGRCKPRFVLNAAAPRRARHQPPWLRPATHVRLERCLGPRCVDGALTEKRADARTRTPASALGGSGNRMGPFPFRGGSSLRLGTHSTVKAALPCRVPFLIICAQGTGCPSDFLILGYDIPWCLTMYRNLLTDIHYYISFFQEIYLLLLFIFERKTKRQT